MKTSYYVILYRPHGSKTWTPFAVQGRAVGNFFASKNSAEQEIMRTIKHGYSCYLPGPKAIVPAEFVVGRVTPVSKAPWVVSDVPEVGAT